MSASRPRGRARVAASASGRRAGAGPSNFESVAAPGEAGDPGWQSPTFAGPRHAVASANRSERAPGSVSTALKRTRSDLHTAEACAAGVRSSSRCGGRADCGDDVAGADQTRRTLAFGVAADGSMFSSGSPASAGSVPSAPGFCGRGAASPEHSLGQPFERPDAARAESTSEAAPRTQRPRLTLDEDAMSAVAGGQLALGASGRAAKERLGEVCGMGSLAIDAGMCTSAKSGDSSPPLVTPVDAIGSSWATSQRWVIPPAFAATRWEGARKPQRPADAQSPRPGGRTGASQQRGAHQ